MLYEILMPIASKTIHKYPGESKYPNVSTMITPGNGKDVPSKNITRNNPGSPID